MSEAQSVKNLASERERERDKKNCVNSNNQHSNKHGEKFDEGKEEKRKKISNSYYLHMNASMETEDVSLLHTIYTHMTIQQQQTMKIEGSKIQKKTYSRDI